MVEKTGASLVAVFDVKKTSKWSFGNVWGNPLGSCLRCPIVCSIISPLSNQGKVAKPQIGAQKNIGKRVCEHLKSKIPDWNLHVVDRHFIVFSSKIGTLVSTTQGRTTQKIAQPHSCVRSWLFSVSPSPWPSAAWCPNLWGAVHLISPGEEN